MQVIPNEYFIRSQHDYSGFLLSIPNANICGLSAECFGGIKYAVPWTPWNSLSPRSTADHVQTGRTGPQEQMGIKQQLHSLPSNSRSISSLPMRSKSSGTVIWPVEKPNRFMGVPSIASSRDTFTRGLPALAIINGSPLTAFSIRRERLVFA